MLPLLVQLDVDVLVMKYHRREAADEDWHQDQQTGSQFSPIHKTPLAATFRGEYNRMLGRRIRFVLYFID